MSLANNKNKSFLTQNCSYSFAKLFFISMYYLLKQKRLRQLVTKFVNTLSFGVFFCTIFLHFKKPIRHLDWYFSVLLKHNFLKKEKKLAFRYQQGEQLKGYTWHCIGCCNRFVQDSYCQEWFHWRSSCTCNKYLVFFRCFKVKLGISIQKHTSR